LARARLPARAIALQADGAPFWVWRGERSQELVDCAVQEIDIRTGLVMWAWHSLGHVDVSESYSKAPTGSESPYDYFHLNSVQLLANGDFLISARNT